MDIEPRITDSIDSIRDTFRSAGFAVEPVLKALDITAYPNARELAKSMPCFLDLTRDLSPLDILIRIFVLGSGLPTEKVRYVFTNSIEKWMECGIVRIEGDIAYGAVEICPVEEFLFASDRSSARGKFDDVMTPAPSSRALAQMTIRRPVRAVLDLGTGCGMQAALAAGHSTEVVGLDVNERALRFAAFNAAFNGISNVSFASGDLFEPVAGRTFDLIVCNPPFVIGPKLGYQHSSTNESADRFCERIARMAASYLNDGGYFQMVCNWASVEGESSRERIEDWFAGSGCDVWVLVDHAEASADYALGRATEIATGPEELETLCEEWKQYLKRERIDNINFGVVTARRRDNATSNWFRYNEMPPTAGPCGESIALGFELQDFLASNVDVRRLLDSRLRRFPNLEIHLDDPTDQTSHYSRVRIGSGLRFSTRLERDIVKFLEDCTGEVTLNKQLGQVANRNNMTSSQIMPEFTRVVRHLVEYGFLVPAELFEGRNTNPVKRTSFPD